MKYRALLPLITYPDASSDAALENAIAFAKQLDARLHALAINVDIPPISNALSTFMLNLPQMIRDAETLSRRHGRQLLAEVTSQAAKAGVEFSTQEIAVGPLEMGDAAAVAARYFDIALLGWQAGNPSARAAAEAVIFGSGRPTILLPEVSGPVAIERVAIAWDGSRVAARAVADARPFLARAAVISVLTVTGEKPLRDENPARRLVDKFRSVDLPAEILSIEADERPIGVTLQEHAIELGSSLLVMGGYGHSRVREFVLGGATEGVLSDLRLPVLVSH